MKELLETITKLHNKNAVHGKRNTKLQDYSLTDILKHAGEELIELASDQYDRKEFSDLMCCLLHYMVKQNWTMDEIESISLTKLEEIFGKV